MNSGSYAAWRAASPPEMFGEPDEDPYDGDAMLEYERRWGGLRREATPEHAARKRARSVERPPVRMGDGTCATRPELFFRPVLRAPGRALVREHPYNAAREVCEYVVAYRDGGLHMSRLGMWQFVRYFQQHPEPDAGCVGPEWCGECPPCRDAAAIRQLEHDWYAAAAAAQAEADPGPF
jgi:hypothetical protein